MSVPAAKHSAPTTWEVVQNGRVVCTNLTRWQAENKVENERRMGWYMEARRALGDSNEK